MCACGPCAYEKSINSSPNFSCFSTGRQNKTSFRIVSLSLKQLILEKNICEKYCVKQQSSREYGLQSDGSTPTFPDVRTAMTK